MGGGSPDRQSMSESKGPWAGIRNTSFICSEATVAHTLTAMLQYNTWHHHVSLTGVLTINAEPMPALSLAYK